MKRPLLWIAGIVSILALYTILFAASKDGANQKEAIAAIKRSFAPSPQLLSMHPDFMEAQWTAVKYPGRVQGYADAYEVILWVDVIPEDNRKMLKAEWIVFASGTKYLADNMEAQTLFAPH